MEYVEDNRDDWARWVFLRVVEGVLAVMDRSPTAGVTEALAAVDGAVEALRAIDTPFSKLLQNDLRADDDPSAGQVYRAVQNWEKWGMHYLPAVWFAHRRQERSNFKDLSQTHYGGSEVVALIEKGDEIFRNLPTPAPSLLQTVTAIGAGGGAVGKTCRGIGGTWGPTRAYSMSTMHCQATSCFTWDTPVRMKSGEPCLISNLKKGDVLYGGSMVRCVVVSMAKELVKIGHIGVTPWHPLYMDGVWTFAAMLGGKRDINQVPPTPVYNLVLWHRDDYIYLYTDNNKWIATVTLGHSYTRPAVVSHPYFGSPRVIEDLERLPGFVEGRVTLTGQWLRDPETGTVCGYEEPKDSVPSSSTFPTTNDDGGGWEDLFWELSGDLRRVYDQFRSRWAGPCTAWFQSRKDLHRRRR